MNYFLIALLLLKSRDAQQFNYYEQVVLPKAKENCLFYSHFS